MRLLKQSTATTLLLGPFLDETDGKTAETALTISQSDVLLWKEGGTTLAQKNESTTCTHRSNGLYTCPINTTDTGTLGTLVVSVHESGALPIRQDYTVVVANIYDSLVLNTDKFQVDMQEVAGYAGGATNMRESARAIVQGTSTNASFTATTTVMDTTLTEATDDHYVGRVVLFGTGALAGQGGTISDYALVAGKGRITFADALTEAVPDASTFVIV